MPKPNRDTRAFIEQPEPVDKVCDWPRELPPPGIYHDVPEKEYRAWPAISQSGLKFGLHTSQRHVKSLLDGALKDKDSSAKRLGRAIHCGVLEPAKWAEKFAVAKPCQAVISTGARKGKTCDSASRYRANGHWFCGTHAKAFGGVEVRDMATEEEVEAIKLIKASLQQQDVIKLLRTRGGEEVSCTCWLYGFPFKWRVDRLCASDREQRFPQTVLDLKKIQSGGGGEESLRKTIRSWDYDLQAAAYTMGLENLTQEPTAYVWIFVEESHPFETASRQASERMLKLGHAKLFQAAQAYRWSVENNLWLGYSTTLDQIDPDDWECFRWGITEETGR